MTLVEFLLARIADDEAVATAAETEPKYFGLGDDAYAEMLYLARGEGAQDTATAHAERYSPKRILAECAAKRSIAEYAVMRGIEKASIMPAVGAVLDVVLAHLAEPYADHPDYREEWRA